MFDKISFIGRMNFRNKLMFSIVSVTLLAILVLSVSSYILAYKGIMNEEYKSLDQIVKKTTTEIDTWIADRERDATLFAANSTFTEACLGKNVSVAQAKLLEYHKHSPLYENIFLADAKGVLFIDTIDGKTVGADISKIPDFKPNYEHAVKGEAFVGDVKKSPGTGRPVSLITAPIMSEGRLIGVIGTPVELNNFSETFVSQTKIGDTGYVFMMDSKGMTLAHPKKDSILKVNFAKDFDWGKKMVEEKKGSIEYTYDNVGKVVSFGSSAKTGWIIAATMTKAELLASVSKIKYLSFFLGLGAIALVTFVLWLITGNVFRVIERVSSELDQASDQIASASTEVASASQSLAQGASEQASSIQETTSAASAAMR